MFEASDAFVRASAGRRPGGRGGCGSCVVRPQLLDWLQTSVNRSPLSVWDSGAKVEAFDMGSSGCLNCPTLSCAPLQDPGRQPGPTRVRIMCHCASRELIAWLQTSVYRSPLTVWDSVTKFDALYMGSSGCLKRPALSCAPLQDRGRRHREGRRRCQCVPSSLLGSQLV